MYTLGLSNRQKRRALGYLKQNWINFEQSPSMDGFVDLSFPGVDEEGFRSIVLQLKQQGVALMGVDSQLTERKMKKLTDLMNEVEGYSIDYPMLGDDSEEGPSQGFESNPLKDIILDLELMLDKWKTLSYDSPTHRYTEYNLDLEELKDSYKLGLEDYDGDSEDDEEDEEDEGVEMRKDEEEKMRKKIRTELKKTFQ
jgi:hypothetical protein